ncbi:MAG: PAS domain S-box protein [Elusimicrobia bacterium]|nr:PAS domain S-box protein [Elusimicrobiota bacterium]
MPKTPRAVEPGEGYRLLFETNPEPMFILDRKSLAFMAVNESALTQYGFTREELLGMRLPDL